VDGKKETQARYRLGQTGLLEHLRINFDILDRAWFPARGSPWRNHTQSLSIPPGISRMACNSLEQRRNIAVTVYEGKASTVISMLPL